MESQVGCQYFFNVEYLVHTLAFSQNNVHGPSLGRQERFWFIHMNPVANPPNQTQILQYLPLYLLPLPTTSGAPYYIVPNPETGPTSSQSHLIVIQFSYSQK